MTAETADSNLQSYQRVVLSFMQGLVRLWGAEAASARLMCALSEFHLSSQAGLDGPARRALQHLAKIKYSSFDSLAYVTNVSHLVYATSLLDTFLFDTTLFLFLLFPQSMGKNQQVPLRTLIDASSRHEALARAALARSREISYLPFSGRVQFLRDKFSLEIYIEPNDCEALEHYPSIRNTAVHDQGIFELSLDENGHVTAKQKTCQAHPTRVNGDDVHNATEVYERVAKQVAKAVMVQVLKQPDDGRVKSWLSASTQAPDDTSNPGAAPNA